MKIKSTSISVKSTHGVNKSTEGSDQSIRHSDSNKHPSVKAGNPGKVAIKPELNYEPKNKGITGGRGKNAPCNDAAYEKMVKHGSNYPR